jgi:hypothetical protein
MVCKIPRVYLVGVFVLLAVSVSSVSAEAKSWTESYIEAQEFLKAKDMSSAALAYYRAQLASSWARELRPAAFVGNGNDPGTFRAAMNQVLGQSINPWAFEDSKARLLPLLEKLEKEVAAVKTDKELAESIYSGITESGQNRYEAKYPYVIPIEGRLAAFKDFAAKWIAQGRIVANR